MGVPRQGWQSGERCGACKVNSSTATVNIAHTHTNYSVWSRIKLTLCMGVAIPPQPPVNPAHTYTKLSVWRRDKLTF